jgi:hypothetical protein
MNISGPNEWPQHLDVSGNVHDKPRPDKQLKN